MASIREKARSAGSSTQGITIRVDFGDGEPEPVRVKALTRSDTSTLSDALEDPEDDARLICRCCFDPETDEPAFDEQEDLEWLKEDVPMHAVVDGWHARLSEAIAYVNGLRADPPEGYRDKRYGVIEQKARKLRGVVRETDISDADGADRLDGLLSQIVDFAQKGGDVHESIETAAEGVWDLCEDLVDQEAMAHSRADRIRKAIDGIHDVARNIARKDGDQAYVKKRRAR